MGIFFFYFILFSGSIVKLEEHNNLELKNGVIVGVLRHVCKLIVYSPLAFSEMALAIKG
jgi:hypothetical protein